MTPVCRNIQNNDLYQYLGGNTFKNIRTGAQGEIPGELAQSTLKVNVEATQLLHDYPVLEEMIQKLNLKLSLGKK